MDRFVTRSVGEKRACDSESNVTLKRLKIEKNEVENEEMSTVAQRKAVPNAYQRWKLNNLWLALNERNEMICSICTMACDKKLISHFNSNDVASKETWVKNGFSNWKHGPERIKKHSQSSLHVNCAERLKHLNLEQVNVVQHLSTAVKKQMMENRIALKKIFSTLRILGRQGLPIRGCDNDENSNFMIILKARAEDVTELDSWLKRTGHKWVHHDIQNVILQAMSSKVMLKVIQEIKSAEYFSILLDETADITRTEQVSIYFRVVSPNIIISEYFMGFYPTSNTKAETLFNIVNNVCKRYDLPLSKLRGQCYDGAANVSGKVSGLQQRIREKEPRALVVHCNAHNLNLVIQDSVEKVLAAKKFIGEVKDMINFVKDSPKRVTQFQELQASAKEKNKMNVPVLAAYCPTRWVIRIKSLKTILDNYGTLITFFQELI